MGGAGATAPEVWTGDRTITAPWENANETDLEIAAGTNVSFEVPSTLPPDLKNNTPSITVWDGLIVNGTAERPVTFDADETLEAVFNGHPYLFIIGDGTPAQYLVQNCTFSNMNVLVDEAAGEFSGCVFLECIVRVYDTPTVVRNCTFLESCLEVHTETSNNVTVVAGCRFDGNYSRKGLDFTAIYGYGNVKIDNSRFSDFFWPIHSTSGTLVMTGCHISDADFEGIVLSTGEGKQRSSAPVIRDTVLEDCGEQCIWTNEAAVITNCTLSGSKYGLVAANWAFGPSFEVVMEGNRIFNNSEYGIQCGPPDGANISGLENNTFDDGAGRTNVKGRLVRHIQFWADAIDQWGAGLGLEALCWTDALGNPGGSAVYRASYVEFDSYHIDNDGIRRDHFPATFWAEKNGMTCRTVRAGPMKSLYLVFTIPPKADIAIGRVRTVPASPKDGDYLSFNVSVRCVGENSSVTVMVLVDGVERRDVSLGRMPANATWSFIVGGMRANKGRHTVEVRLDPRNNVHETDEGNNNRTIEYVVAGPPTLPDERGILLGLTVFATAVFVVMVVSLVWLMRKEGAAGRPR
jgi:hypothetical protein